jgi:hypothetical protein
MALLPRVAGFMGLGAGWSGSCGAAELRTHPRVRRPRTLSAWRLEKIGAAAVACPFPARASSHDPVSLLYALTACSGPAVAILRFSAGRRVIVSLPEFDSWWACGP